LPKKIFILDNYDSFTYNIYHALARPGFDIVIRQPHQTSLKKIQMINPGAVIFSPGPKRPGNYPLMHALLDAYVDNKPILGICLGMQAINEYFGGNTIKAIEPVHGKVSRIDILGGKLFSSMPDTLKVARYHSLIVDNVADEFRITARYGKVIMAFEHITYRVHGVQFHPESFLTDDGHQIFENFLAGV